eukprot:11202169-Lingulodinium_polyedra.AAC.1
MAPSSLSSADAASPRSVFSAMLVVFFVEAVHLWSAPCWGRAAGPRRRRALSLARPGRRAGP